MSWNGGNNYLTLAQMTENAQYVLDYLTAAGWTKNAICGVLGNLETESNINPQLWQGAAGNTNLGYGLVQWTPATNLISWCNANSLDYTQMDSQLQRILWEVDNNQQWIYSAMTFAEFTQSTDTAYNLAMLFLSKYERPANPNQPARGSQATAWFNLLTAGTGGGGDPQGAAKVESAVQWALAIAADDSHGYDQTNRQGPDYDCSSFLIAAYDQAGIGLTAAGASYTGNMRAAALAAGFLEVAWNNDPALLMRGDIILKESSHVVMSIGNGQLVAASINELGSATGGQTGDQTGAEIHTQAYYVHSGGWDCVLRYNVGSGGGVVVDYYKLLDPYQFGSYEKISYTVNKFLLLTTHGNVARIQHITNNRKYYVNRSHLKKI